MRNIYIKTAIISPLLLAGSQHQKYFVYRLAKTSGGLTAKWVRQFKFSPVKMASEFVENHIVTKINASLYVNLYKGTDRQALSYACPKYTITFTLPTLTRTILSIKCRYSTGVTGIQNGYSKVMLKSRIVAKTVYDAL